MFVVDTNILLYAMSEYFKEHQPAKRSLEAWLRGPDQWFLTWSVVYEFLRTATHRKVLPRPLTFPQAWGYVTQILASPNVTLLVETDRHAGVVRELSEAHPHVHGNPIHDLHVAALMKEHGVSEIRTADTDFHQFRFLRVANPLG